VGIKMLDQIKLSIQDPLPYCLQIPRILNFYLDKTLEEQGKLGVDLKVDFNSKVRLSNHSQLIKVASLP